MPNLFITDRTIEEFQQADLEWQFWTKIVVETIGAIGATILIYVWGKLYVSLIRKWIIFNRTFVIINSTPAPLKQKPSNCSSNTKNSSNSNNALTTKESTSSSPPLYHQCQVDPIVVVHPSTNNYISTSSATTTTEINTSGIASAVAGGIGGPLSSTNDEVEVAMNNSDDERTCSNTNCEVNQPLLVSSGIPTKHSYCCPDQHDKM